MINTHSPGKRQLLSTGHFSDANLPMNSSTDGKVSIENATYQGQLLPSVSVSSPNQQGDQSEWWLFRREVLTDAIAQFVRVSTKETPRGLTEINIHEEE